jgi:hypothetical protein
MEAVLKELLAKTHLIKRCYECYTVVDFNNDPITKTYCIRKTHGIPREWFLGDRFGIRSHKNFNKKYRWNGKEYVEYGDLTARFLMKDNKVVGMLTTTPGS